MIGQVGTVTVELTYEDALRLWVLVHEPAHAGKNSADPRIQRVVAEAISITESELADG